MVATASLATGHAHQRFYSYPFYPASFVPTASSCKPSKNQTSGTICRPAILWLTCDTAYAVVTP